MSGTTLFKLFRCWGVRKNDDNMDLYEMDEEDDAAETCPSTYIIEDSCNKVDANRREVNKKINIDNRIDIEHKFKNSAPCAECIKYLKHYNIQKIIYSIDDGSLQFSRVKELDDTHISRGQRAINRMRSLSI